MTATAATPKMVPVDSIVFRQDLYPRLDPVKDLVQTYVETLDLLPPIEINQDSVLIDGWHRWKAHQTVGRTEIAVIVTPTENDVELLYLAITRNATHGAQMSMEEKRAVAQQIYKATPPQEQGREKARLAMVLAVTERTIHNWLARTDKDNKEQRDAAVFRLWLACYTEEKIAEKVGMSRDAVHRVLCEIENFQIHTKPGFLREIDDDAERWRQIEQMNRLAAAHKSDFALPLYDVWKQQEKTKGSEHFGNTEPRWLDNLIYLYTKPFDIVVDPFAGGGSTIEVCRQRFRRYWVSDRKPIVGRAHEIRQHDMTTGLPKLPRWKDVSLVYLDPPYWKQAEGQYSTDAEDLANMSLDAFHEALATIIDGFGKKLSPGAKIALVMQPTQWNAPDREVIDHAWVVGRCVTLPLHHRYSVPYESQQCNAQMVEWAKANRQCLVLAREIVVWRVPDVAA